ncbi:unnamed protein product [Lathyrus oleraceus]
MALSTQWFGVRFRPVSQQTANCQSVPSVGDDESNMKMVDCSLMNGNYQSRATDQKFAFILMMVSNRDEHVFCGVFKEVAGS